VVETVPDATLAPIRAVFTESGKTYAYRAAGGQFERVPVTVGGRNDLVVELRSGLRPGDRVALVRPPVRAAEAGR